MSTTNDVQRERLEAEIRALDARAAGLSDVIKRAEARDYTDAEAHRYSEAAYQAAIKAGPMVQEQLRGLHNRLAYVLAGQPDPGDPATKKEAPRLHLAPVRNEKSASRPFDPKPPINQRKDLTTGRGRTYDELLDLNDAGARAMEAAQDEVEGAFYEARQIYGSDNRTYAFDAASFTAMKLLLAKSLGYRELDLAANGVLRRESEAKLLDRIAELEKRIDGIETTGLEYQGIHQRALAYRKGSVVTHQGAAWVALRDTAGEVPGSNLDAWQLMVKAGKDGKDATR